MSRLPSSDQFAKLSVIDQSGVLEYHWAQIEAEIWGLKSGTIRTERRPRSHYLKLARTRMRRLEKLAHDFGHGLPG